MPVEVIMPKVDMDMTHGTLAVWHVAEGGFVEKGAPLFDIETDKAAMEVEAPASGWLRGISALPGAKVPVGAAVALLFAEGEDWAATGVAEDDKGAASVPGMVTPEVGQRPIEVILPKVDMDMSHGLIATWHVGEGGRIEKGAPLFDIETDKAAMEVEAPATGHLHHVTASAGDRVAVGAVVAYIYPDGVPVTAKPGVAEPNDGARTGSESLSPLTASLPTVLPQAAPDTGAVLSEGSFRATPAARLAARQAGLQLSQIAGTGPRGRIQRQDVLFWDDGRTSGQPSLRSTQPDVSPQTWTPEPGPLSITRRGGEGAPILLIHGFSADSLSWARFEKALRLPHPLIRIDLPGHGKSPKRPVADFADLAKMMVKAFDSLPDEQPIHIVGHSLGGAIAMAIADLRARKVASLSLIAPAGLGPEIDANTLNGIVRASRHESLGPWLRRMTADPADISDDYVRAAMKLRADPALRLCQAAMSDRLFPDGVQSFDLRPALGRLECATTIIWGKRDSIIPNRQSLVVDGDFGIHLLSNTGHVPQIECPDRLARIVSRHIVASGVHV